MRRWGRNLLVYVLCVAVLSAAGSIVIGWDVLPLAAWALIFYPPLVFVWWFCRSPERFRPREEASE